MTEKYEFASDEWIECVSRYLHDRLDGVDLSEYHVTSCEEFTDPPAHLANGGTTIGWHMTIHDGEVTVGKGVLDTPYKQVADYEAMLPFARVHIDVTDVEGMAKLQEDANAVIAAGKLTPATPDPDATALPSEIEDMHNYLAERTR